MDDKSANFLSLFASSSTLICCALPSMFVLLGAGATFASIITVFPFLIVLSQYKIWITSFALIRLALAGYVNYKTYHMPCPLILSWEGYVQNLERDHAISIIFQLSYFYSQLSSLMLFLDLSNESS